MDARSWAGSGIWSNEDEPLLVRTVTAELRLDDQGGRVLSDVGLFGSRLDIRFGWAEVKKVERLRFCGIPILGEALRVTLTKNTPTANQRGVRRSVHFRWPDEEKDHRADARLRRVEGREGPAQGPLRV